MRAISGTSGSLKWTRPDSRPKHKSAVLHALCWLVVAAWSFAILRDEEYGKRLNHYIEGLSSAGDGPKDCGCEAEPEGANNATAKA